MILPSKELLSEVLEVEVIEVKDKTTGALYVPDNSIGFAWEEEIAGLINIHELAHKCKEWALSKNYEIESSLFVDGNKKRIGYSQVLRKESPMLQKTADTEPEAIFKACEYILKELSNK